MTEIIKKDEEIQKYMRLIVNQNRMRMVIIRGLVIGIFTSIGTLVGLAIIAFVGVNFLGGLRQIPLIDVILEQTKLDIVIENQVSRFTGGSEQPKEENPEVTTIQEPVVTYSSYSDDITGVHFDYPSTFNSVSTREEGEGSVRIVQLLGDGPLLTMDVYLNVPPVIVGNSTQRFIQLSNGSRAVQNVYAEGAVIEGGQFGTTIYHTQLKSSTGSFDFVGYSDPEFPKTAREVFSTLIQSVSFSK